MFLTKHHVLRCAVAALTSTVVALGLAVAPAGAAELGGKPDVERVRHFQSTPFQRLAWSTVRGADSYQVFVKGARYDHRLPREWKLLKTVDRNRTTVFVGAGRTRQFGVRAVGAPDGMRHAVTAISSFGTISRPARLAALDRVGRWRTVRDQNLYRNVALEASRHRAKLLLRHAKDTSTVRLVAATGPAYGVVDVYIGRDRIRRIDLGSYRANPDRRIRIRVRPADSGTIRVVTRGSDPVRISAVAHTRRFTRATETPPAPLAHPPARSFTFRGSGWGHGVGLSQYGAMAMAEAGRSVRDILGHYYRGTELGHADDSRLVGVNVRYHAARITARPRALAGEAEMEICAIRRHGCVDRAVLRDTTGEAEPSGQVVLTRGSRAVRARVVDASGEISTLRGNRIRIRWSGTRDLAGDPSVVRLGNNREYRHGELVIHKHDTRLLNAVVRMRLQSEYLRGVAEMPSSWDLEALRAQAIIARTYALRTGAGFKPDCDCNLRDSVVHQAYVGWGKESEGNDAHYGKRWVSAVDSTDGQVLTYDGELAGTFYYSSSGGHTLNSEDVWSATVPYLRAVDDPWSLTSENPNRSWTTVRSQAAMASVFGLDDIHKISISRRYDGGAIRSLKATASTGESRTITGKADYLRTLFGLKSAWVRSIRESY